VPGINGTTILIILLFLKSFPHWQPFCKLNYNPPDLAKSLLGLFAVVTFSIIYSNVVYGYQSLPLIDYFIKLKRWFMFIFLYFLYKHELTTRKKIKYALMAMAIGIFLEGVFVVKAVFLSGRWRAYGTIGQANELGQFFSTYFLIPLILLIHERGIIKKIFFSIIIVLSLYGIVLTLSRGGFLVFAISALIFLFFRSRKLAIILMVFSVFFYGTFQNILPKKVVSRIEETFAKNEATRSVNGIPIEASAYSRIPLAKAGLIMFKENPLLGKGFMSYNLLVPRFKYGGQFGIDHPKASHDMHIRILAELGIVGYVFFISIFINSSKLGYTTFKLASHDRDKDIGIITLCASIAFVIGCLFGDRFFRGILITYFFVLSALCYNLYCIISRERLT